LLSSSSPICKSCFLILIALNSLLDMIWGMVAAVTVWLVAVYACKSCWFCFGDVATLGRKFRPLLSFSSKAFLFVGEFLVVVIFLFAVFLSTLGYFAIFYSCKCFNILPFLSVFLFSTSRFNFYKYN